MSRALRVPRAAVAVLAVPVALIALSGCTQPDALPGPSASSFLSTPTPSPTATPLAVTAVADLAASAVGSGTVVSVEDEAAGTLWDVKVVLDDGEEQEVHLSTAGKVVAGPSSATTDADTQSANRALVAASSVSLSSAAAKMRAVVTGPRITAITLGQYRGRVVWQGDVLNARGVRQDVRIDAVNGSVLLNRTDGQGSSTGS